MKAKRPPIEEKLIKTNLHSLDIKDRKILYELDMNSRQSFARIGRKVGLSKEVVNYRVKRLMKCGIIRQFHTVINVGKLGYTSFRLFLKFQNTTPAKEEEIIGYLKKQRILQWIVSVEGNWDLSMWFCVKEIREFNEFWKKFFDRYLSYVGDNKLFIFTEVIYLHRAYFLDKVLERPKGNLFISLPERQKVDGLDWGILCALAPNARMPIIEIARKLEVTEKTVEKRIKDLTKKGIIVGFRTSFDLEKLGVLYYKIHFKLQNLTPEKIKCFRTYVRFHPNAIYYNEVVGGWDLEFELQVKSEERFHEIMDDVKNKFTELIRDCEVLRYHSAHKFLFIPLFMPTKKG